jgi:hypothetical protein
MTDSRYVKLGQVIHDLAEIPGPVTEFHHMAAKGQIDIVEKARLVVVDPDSPGLRRYLVEQLTHLMQPHEGKVMYQADKWSTQAVNLLLATLNAQAYLAQNGEHRA